MIRNYLRIALRNFKRQKGFTLLNVIGLAVGLASAAFIFLFIIDEYGFDRFHPDADNIYVLGAQGKYNGMQSATVMAPGAWVQALKDEFPEVKSATQMLSPGFPASFRNSEVDRIVLSEQFFCVTPDFKDVFYFSLTHGNPATAFQDNRSVVLSETAAARLFGSQNPVGETLEIKHVFLSPDKYTPLKVTGVMKDYPQNSHIRPDYLLSMDLFAEQQSWQQNWGADYGWFNSYVRTTDQANVTSLVDEFEKMIQTHLPKEVDRFTEPFLLPLKDLHFDEELNIDGIPRADIKYLYIFACTALLVLVMAAINYTNLATARAVWRAKEIGLRKVMGGRRWQLIGQFLGESLLTSFAALLVGLLLVALLLPIFNSISDRQFTFNHLLQGQLIFVLLGTTVLVGLLAGSYPAIYLSGLRPISVLKNTRFVSGSSGLFRKGLIMLQYAVTLLLIVATGVMIQQLNFIRSSALSQKSDQMLSIRWSGVASLDKYQILKSRIQEDPQLQVVTMANHLPIQDYFGSLQHHVDFPELDEQPYEWSALFGDYDFPEAFNLELIAGRGFDRGNQADSNAYLLNESAVKALNLPIEKVLGLSLQIKPSWDESNNKKSGVVIGVVRDFPYQSFRHSISPAVINAHPDPIDQIVYVKLPAGMYQEKIANLEKIWKQVLPEDGFDHWFMSEEFESMYESETRMVNLSKTFSLLSILIASVGLFGLSSYMARRRSKEIAVRKVVGARVPGIFWLMFTTFLKLLAFACLVAVPIAWFAMKSWLEDFTYQVELGPLIFFLAILLVVLLTVASVSYETIRAAIANPVNALKQE
ncbi:ABC transporter permease [Algoriphagus terrigena]|uniref:ABC transporter permease n=1 Tax=Algoriphagus terrigena TaxID=344884 RepID=UPI00040047B5|nr:ABC transporter permease [Algoriphagus terrigena]